MKKKLILENIKTTEECLKQLHEKIKITEQEGKKILEACATGIEVNEFVLESFKKALKN